jgi:hypothetical protein
MTKEDRERLAKVRAKVIEIRDELVQAKDAEGLAKVGTAADVDLIYGELAYLGSRYGVPMPRRRNPAEIASGARSLLVADSGLGKTIHDVAQWLEEALAATAKAAQSAAVLQTFRWVGDALIFAVAIATAIVTGLSAFYFGKPFGSFEDYLTLILTGTAAAALSKVLLDGLERFWVGDAAAPEATSDAKPATVDAKDGVAPLQSEAA